MDWARAAETAGPVTAEPRGGPTMRTNVRRPRQSPKKHERAAIPLPLVRRIERFLALYNVDEPEDLPNMSVMLKMQADLARAVREHEAQQQRELARRCRSARQENA